MGRTGITQTKFPEEDICTPDKLGEKCFYDLYNPPNGEGMVSMKKKTYWKRAKREHVQNSEAAVWRVTKKRRGVSLNAISDIFGIFKYDNLL